MMPGGRLSQVARRELEDWKAARRRVLRSGATRGAVHEWRIRTRRLLALEALLAPRGAAARGDLLHAELHDAFHASGRLRDAQLNRRAMKTLSCSIPEAARLARHEKERLPRLERRLLRELRRLSIVRIRRIVEAWLPPDSGDGETAILTRAERRLLSGHRRAARPLASHTAPHDLHRRRIHLKQVRYMAELWRAAGRPLPRGMGPARLTRLQAGLGALTDIDMQLRAVSRFAADHPQWHPAARALRSELRRRRALLSVPRVTPVTGKPPVST